MKQIAVLSVLVLGLAISVVLTQKPQDTRTQAATGNSFPYPRGTQPPYGWISIGSISSSNKAVTDGFTLLHPYYSSNYSSSAVVNFANAAKGLGVEQYFVPSMPNIANWDSWFSAIKSAGITDADLLGFYYPDEMRDTSALTAIDTARKKYFPNTIAMNYGFEWNGVGPKFVDVGLFTAYSIYEGHSGRSHAFVYGWLRDHLPAWENAGKTVYSAVEAFGTACKGSSSVDINTDQKIHDRIISQIVQGIIGGAQGVFAYQYDSSSNTPCYTGLKDFKDKYFEIWPWIMQGNRQQLSVNITSGPTATKSSADISSPKSLPAVMAFQFTDTSGKQLIVSTSMLGWSESSSANQAVIQGVTNGTWNVLWENRQVTVTNNTISDSWNPYQYHFYTNSSSGGSNPTPTPPPTGEYNQADINHDGVVNLLDYVLLFENFGAIGSNSADINNDSKVNILDFVILFENFWETS